MRTALVKGEGKEMGFTLMEVRDATIVLLTGIVATAQLVPVAGTANNNNRRDSTALVIAQRELSQMIERPMSAPPVPDNTGKVCNLGAPAQPGNRLGDPVGGVGHPP